METKARNVSKELCNGLIASRTRSELIKWFSAAKALLVPSSRNSLVVLSTVFGHGNEELKEIQKNILLSHAVQIYEFIIKRLDLDLLKELSHSEYDDLLKSLFLEGPPQTVLTVLTETVLHSERQNFAFNKCILILEEFMTQERLSVLLQQCSKQHSSSPSTTLDTGHEYLVSLLASFPDKIANRLAHENSNSFLPQAYIPMLALAIMDCLQWSYDLLVGGQNASLLMVSTLIGKLCMIRYADLLLDTLLPHLCVKVRSDFIWRRICQRIFSGVPSRYLESVVLAVLQKLPWYGLLEHFLGDCVLHSSKIKMLLCTKLLLHRHFSSPRLILCNTIGYLSSFQTRRPLFLEMCRNLLQVWGDASSIRHISTEQHCYISKALMLSVSLLNDVEKRNLNKEFLCLLMPGVQAHLESTNHDIRMLGMAFAKYLISLIDPSGPQLEFEVDTANLKVAELLKFQGLPADPGPMQAEKEIVARENDRESKRETRETLNKEAVPSEVTQNLSKQEDLDSDDDLEPYDMSNDKKTSDIKPPRYVRDCMEGLISNSEDADKLEICLQHAECLIRKSVDGLDEISVEFAKVLLHLTDPASCDNFQVDRFASLVALTVKCPSQVSDYLSSQFYERNYAIKQRLDILEVLSTAAQELSQPEKAPPLMNKSKPQAPRCSHETGPQTWQHIVQQRIESNTRRFAHGRSRPELKPTQNRFTLVAGQFFYPLMTQVDKANPALDLVDKDHLLLHRLLYTLSIVLHAAINLPNATQMGHSLLDFTWPLRFHSEAPVRQAVLVATTTIFFVVPGFKLLTELHSEITEVKLWLEDMIEKDADTECQKLSAQALMVLENQLKKEAQSMPT